MHLHVQRPIVAFLVVVALLALTAPVQAGGWAVVRLDEKPGEVFVKQPWGIGFMVMQHDVHPNGDVTPVLRAVHKESGEEITVTGEPEGAVGHFVAEVTFPLAGEWKWSIEPEPFAETSFETLTVREDSGELSTAAQPAATSSDETQTIEMLDAWLFQPAKIEAAPGTTVTWVNQSSIVHTVTGDDLAFDDSGLIEPGESFSLTFTEPGTYRYRCSPHPGMEGVIVVG